MCAENGAISSIGSIPFLDVDKWAHERTDPAPTHRLESRTRSYVFRLRGYMIRLVDDRCLLHGKLSLDADKVEVTALLDRSPAALGASLRLLVSKAKVRHVAILAAYALHVFIQVSGHIGFARTG